MDNVTYIKGGVVIGLVGEQSNTPTQTEKPIEQPEDQYEKRVGRPRKQ